MRSVPDRRGGNPLPQKKWTTSWIRHGGEQPPPLPNPPKCIGLEKIAKNRGALPLLTGEPQRHQVFHQPLNVGPQWACICMRQAHSKLRISLMMLTWAKHENLQDISMEPSFENNVCYTPCCVPPVTRHLKIFQIRWKKVNFPSSIGHEWH